MRRNLLTLLLEPMNMGSGREKAAAVNLLVHSNSQWRDTLSKYTAATSTIQITSAPILLLAFELGEESWLLGFSRGFGEKALRRKIKSRDTAALLREIARAKQQLGLDAEVAVHTCYEAGRDGFWLHRFLEAHGVTNYVIDSASIEVNRRKKRAKTDRLDVVGLLDLLSRYLAGSHKPPFSVVTVPPVEAEDLRHLGRELKLVKKDRTRISNRIKGLLANYGLVLENRRNIRGQIENLRMWNGEELPRFLKARLLRYAHDFEFQTDRIKELEVERRALLRNDRSHESMAKVWRLLELKGVGIETAWCYGMEFFGWRNFANRKQVGSLAGLTPTPHDSGKQETERGIGKDGSRWVRGVAIEQAWAWLRFQPDSALSQWYQSRFGGGSKRLRKIGIVALARKLLIALWRFVEFGLVPEGAVASQRLRLV
jgi:transposase